MFFKTELVSKNFPETRTKCKETQILEVKGSQIDRAPFHPRQKCIWRWNAKVVHSDFRPKFVMLKFFSAHVAEKVDYERIFWQMIELGSYL